MKRSGWAPARRGLPARNRTTCFARSRRVHPSGTPPALTVHHPGHRGRFTVVEHARGASYARAMGYLMRRHDAGRDALVYHVARAIGGMLCAILRGRLDVARFHWCVMRGRVRA